MVVAKDSLHNVGYKTHICRVLNQEVSGFREGVGFLKLRAESIKRRAN
jgi:hypothetical protein